MKKKIVAFLLAAIMTAGMGVSSFAAGTNTAAGMQQNMSLSSAAQNKKISTSKKKELTTKQLLELQEAQLSLLDYKEMSAVYFVKKTNTLHLEVVKKASSGLQNRIKQIEKEYGIKTEVKIVDQYEDLLEEVVPPEDLLEEVVPPEDLPEEVVQPTENPVKEKTKEDYAWDFANYLSDQLTGNEYSYITVRQSDAVLEIGVPSVKAMDKAIELVEIYREVKGIKFINQLHPEKYVTVEYHLSPFSRNQIIQAYNSVVQDSLIRKLRGDGSIYSINYHGDRVRIEYIDKGEELKEWREKSKYSSLISLEPFYKVNPQ